MINTLQGVRSGIWVVKSELEETYYVYLDRMFLYRKTEDYSTSNFDNKWIFLVNFTDIEVKKEGIYIADPGGIKFGNYLTWLQPEITSIEAASFDEIPPRNGVRDHL